MRKFLKVALAAAIVAALVAGCRAMARTKWHFMHGTEEELRERVQAQFGDRVPPDKLEKVKDKVVAAARAKGTLAE